MKNERLASLLLVPLSLAFLVRGDSPSFHPSAGSSLTKKFTLESNLTLEKMSMSYNGQDIDPGMEMTMSVNQVIAVTDQYVALAKGHPSKLKRTFDELSSKTQVAMSSQMMPQAQDMTIPGKSELQGLAVEFTWNEDQGDYAVAFADGSKGKEDLLADLVEDTDLREFLPKGEVKEGATWTVEPELLRRVFAPCGAVKIEPENMDEAMGMSGTQTSMDEMLGEFEGDVSAQYAGTRDEGGVRVAVIKLKVDVKSSKDATDIVQARMEGVKLPPEAGDMKMEVKSVEIEYGFNGEGELLWSVEAGLLNSLTLAGQASMAIDTSMDMSMQGQDISIENSMSLAGNQSVTVAAD